MHSPARAPLSLIPRAVTTTSLRFSARAFSTMFTVRCEVLATKPKTLVAHHLNDDAVTIISADRIATIYIGDGRFFTFSG